MKIIDNILRYYTSFKIKHNQSAYIRFLKKKGIQIGSNFIIRGQLSTICIDTSRPSLVSIGDNVTINSYFTLLTHDFVSGIFLNKYQDFIPSSGKTTIGNNVRFGVKTTVLKGVTIGNNCFIAAGSVVTKSIPANSIAGGIPAKVICNIDDYYQRRKIESVNEAFVYARSIKERYNREPIATDFWEEFPLFIDASNIEEYPNIPIKEQLGDAYNFWLQNHKAPFKGLEEFLKASYSTQNSTIEDEKEKTANH